jgi:glycine betaine transporter
LKFNLNSFVRLKGWVFWPPFLLLVTALIYSLVDSASFLEQVTDINNWILKHFDWLFSYTSFFMVLVCVAIMVSPIGKLKIGGKDAVPILNRWRWFTVILCTTIAVGILFWGVAEPLYHLQGPPKSLGADPMSNEAENFSISTVFMHWSFTPYAIYAIPALLFALAYYNRRRSYSLGSILFPFIPADRSGKLNTILDAVCLFALVAGMSAVLGVGILSLSGGIAQLTGTATTPWILGLITIAIVATFTISAASGLLKGIKTLSAINVVIFIGIALFVLLFGPTAEIFGYMGKGLGEYVTNFVPQSLGTGDYSDTEWTHSWTTFYWANWMAWAPITALFLGRIGYGYTVREFMLFNWIIPACFSILWMSIFSGTSLHMELSGTGDLIKSLNENGTESIIYVIFNELPLSLLLIPVFLIAVFISYVTAADSNTEAMSGISTTGISPESPGSPVAIKFLWGIIIGLMAWTMVSFAGIDGIRMLSNLGGFPALILLLAATIGMVVLLVRYRKKD